MNESDLEPVLQLLREDEELLLGRPSRLQLSGLRQWLSRVADLEHDAWYDGDPVAWAETLESLGFAVGVVRPGSKGRGIGSRLIERNEARLRELGAARVHSPALVRGSTRVSLRVDADNPTGATKLYEGVGMSVALEHVVFEKTLA